MSSHARAPKQAKTFALSARIALLKRGMTITDLASEINRPRSSVSKAIHSGRFPQLRKRIAQALQLS